MKCSKRMRVPVQDFDELACRAGLSCGLNYLGADSSGACMFEHQIE